MLDWLSVTDDLDSCRASQLHEWTRGKKRFHDKVRTSSSAPAASAKTQKLSGAFIPKENVIAWAKSVNKPQVPMQRSTPDADEERETQDELGSDGQDT